MDLTISNIMFAIGIISTIFGVYHYFRKPQEELEKDSILNRERDKGKATLLNQQSLESKATALAQQAQWERESVEKRFTEMGLRITEAMTIAQNHIHSVDVKVDELSKNVSFLTNEITRLSTIIAERIPKK